MKYKRIDIRKYDTNNLIVHLEKSFPNIQKLITSKEFRIYSSKHESRERFQI